MEKQRAGELTDYIMLCQMQDLWLEDVFNFPKGDDVVVSCSSRVPEPINQFWISYKEHVAIYGC
jgi:hypothetical protein